MTPPKRHLVIRNHFWLSQLGMLGAGICYWVEARDAAQHLTASSRNKAESLQELSGQNARSAEPEKL